MQRRDCPAAIEGSASVLERSRHLVVAGESGRIDHAELRVGNGPVLPSSTTADGLAWLGDPPGAPTDPLARWPRSRRFRSGGPAAAGRGRPGLPAPARGATDRLPLFRDEVTPDDPP